MMKGNRDKDDNGGWVKVQGKGGRGGVGGGGAWLPVEGQETEAVEIIS